MRTSSVLSLTGATLLGGFVGYAAYFDYKRRNDPEFRRKLRKDAKKTSRELKKRNEDKQKQANDIIQRTVDELNKPGVLPTGAVEKEEVFMQSVQEGEMLLTQGPELYVAAAAAFYKGMKVYPQPMELLTIYKKAVPEEALNYIIEMLSKDPIMMSPGGGSSAAPSGVQLEEVDDESPKSDASKVPGVDNVAANDSDIADSPNAPLFSQRTDSATDSTGNGDASSQEWEKVSQHEEEEKKAEGSEEVAAYPVDHTVATGASEDK
ncbi:hypothetical protein CBS101457_005520 [Exobasidium rhododendri]|nr:hypothetical protein CBS101457_005520 [Exobasidium rhododendri]